MARKCLYPVGLAQLGHALVARSLLQAHQHRMVVVDYAYVPVALRGQLQELAECRTAIVALVEIGAESEQRGLELRGVHHVLFLIRQHRLYQSAQLAQLVRLFAHALCRSRLGRIGHRLQEYELVAGLYEYRRGHLAAGNAQHMLAHRFELAHQGRVVAVARHYAEAVYQLVAKRHFQRVYHQLYIEVVLLIVSVAQRGHHVEGVGQQHLLQLRIPVRVAVDLAQQYVAAYLHLFDYAGEHTLLRAGVLQVNEYGIIRSTQFSPPFTHAIVSRETSPLCMSLRNAPEPAGRFRGA